MTREHALSLSLSEDLTVSFRDRLLHKARYLMQSILRYGCLRARADVSNILRGELEQVAPDMLNFQMLRKFKSHKITSDKRVVLKPSRFVVGTHNVLVWKEFMQHLPLFSKEEISEEKKRVRLVELDKSLKAKKNRTSSSLYMTDCSCGHSTMFNQMMLCGLLKLLLESTLPLRS